MKKLSFFNKIIFVINTFFAIGLLFSFFLPAISPNGFGLLSILSLLVPVLIIGNLIFVLYWILVGFKKQMIQSFLVLILSYFFIPTLYKFSDNNVPESKESLTIMTYNVRKFNKFKWIDTENMDSIISAFIRDEKPDVLAVQEYQNFKKFKIDYPYYSNPLEDLYSDPVENQKYRANLAIFSKYPIVNEGLIRYTKFLYSTMFVDIVKNNDTLRVYNFHFASLGIIPNEDYFGHDDSEKLVKRVRTSFKIQQQQIDTLNDHVKNCKHKVVLAGDMNNTAYSWAYKNVKGDLQDTFLKAGKGFGRTYTFKKFPFRIDYVFVDNDIEIINHKNFRRRHSDHYPTMVTLAF